MRDEPANRDRPAGQPARARQPQVVNHVELEQPILTDFELERLRRNPHNALAQHDDRHHLVDRRRRGRASRPRSSGSAPQAVARRSGGHDPARPQRPGDERRAGPDPVAARLLDRPPRPDPRGDATARRARRRVRRAARDPPPRGADRLRRDGDQPVSDARDDDDARRADGRPRRARWPTPTRSRSPAISKGLLKVLSKIGIATIRSYRGAQIFEIVGIDREVVDEHFTGHALAARRHRPRRDRPRGARPPCPRLSRGRTGWRWPSTSRTPASPPTSEKLLPQGGVYRWRRDGEKHMWDPETIASLQRAARTDDDDGAGVLRGVQPPRQRGERSQRACSAACSSSTSPRAPMPLEEVEPASEIVKRFSTGAMSLGALSPEAHETLAIAMNRLGGMVEQRRGRRGPPPQHPRPERRPAPLADPPGRIRPLRRRPSSTSRAPTRSRSRSPRARSRARAASCPATRSTTTSARSATRCRGPS